MALINGLTKEQILSNIQRETESSLWGEEVKFKPYLLKQTFGDGEQLIYFSTLDDRPYFWYVLVDSHIDVDDLDEEELYQAIEEECGGFDRDYAITHVCHNACIECDHCKDYEDSEYPAISNDSSPHWGFMCNFRTGEYDYDESMF